MGDTFPGNVLIEGEIFNLKKGKHGFHIHEKGDMSQGCQSAGGHYNPFNKSHGGPKDTERHLGDLGNIDVLEDNACTTFKLEDENIKLNGRYSIIGRCLIVHADEGIDLVTCLVNILTDDLGKGQFEDSLTTGHSGARVCCGVIGVAD